MAIWGFVVLGTELCYLDRIAIFGSDDWVDRRGEWLLLGFLDRVKDIGEVNYNGYGNQNVRGRSCFDACADCIFDRSLYSAFNDTVFLLRVYW